MPCEISGAPSRGIGETLSDGFNATAANIKIVVATTYRIEDIGSIQDPLMNTGAFGPRKRAPRIPNCNPTRI